VEPLVIVSSNLPVSDSTDSTKVSVATSRDGAVTVIGFGVGPLITSPDGGKTWIDSGFTSQHWTGVASSPDGSVLAAATYDGGIFVSVNAGNDWTQSAAANGIGQELTDLAVSADGATFVATSYGEFFWTSLDQGRYSTVSIPM